MLKVPFVSSYIKLVVVQSSLRRIKVSFVVVISISSRQFYSRDQNKMARKVNEVVTILKDAIAKIKIKPFTAAFHILRALRHNNGMSFSDTVERDLK